MSATLGFIVLLFFLSLFPCFTPPAQAEIKVVKRGEMWHLNIEIKFFVLPLLLYSFNNHPPKVLGCEVQANKRREGLGDLFLSHCES